VLFRRRRDEVFDPLDDVTAVLLASEDRAVGEDLALLRRIAAEAVIVQDDVELAERLPESSDPRVRRYTQRLREILEHHALMLSASLKLYAVSRRSDRLEAEVDGLALGRPAQWLEDLRAELLADR